jgi:hypothetical protein
MKKISLAIIASFLCFPLFGQALAANQFQVNKKTFTIGTNTYDADYNVIFNQWYKGHKNAEEAKQGEDLSWLNDFTRYYTLDFQEGNIAVGNNDLGIVKIISFSYSGWIRGRLDSIGFIGIEQWLVYDSKTGKLIGAKLEIGTNNVYSTVNLDTLDTPDFIYPLKVSAKNAPVSNINITSGLVSYKNVYENRATSMTVAGVNQYVYQVSGEIAKKLKDADDYAKALKKDIPYFGGKFTPIQQSASSQPANAGSQPSTAVFKDATHRLTEDLNVFSQQDGGSTVIASLKKGDLIQVLEYGEYASWNGITAKWAKVLTSGSKTGWLFSGYLEAK